MLEILLIGSYLRCLILSDIYSYTFSRFNPLSWSISYLLYKNHTSIGFLSSFKSSDLSYYLHLSSQVQSSLYQLVKMNVFSSVILVLCTFLSTHVQAVDVTVVRAHFHNSLFYHLISPQNPALVGQLKTAATQLDRLNLLPEDSDWLFDFTAQPKYTFSPGSVVNANAATFPATVGNGMTMAMISLDPCSMLPPHYHPRASNYVVAVEGTTDTYFIEENGARLVKNTLTPGKMTIFPQASVHTMVNTGMFNSTSGVASCRKLMRAIPRLCQSSTCLGPQQRGPGHAEHG